MLDSGNALYGSEGLNQETSGQAVALAMNAMGYDAMALGERDLALGVANLRMRMAETAFPMLSANIVVADSGELFTRPYALVARGGYRIGIVGLTEAIRPVGPSKEDDIALLDKDPFQSALSHIQSIIDATDMVVVLSNMGQALDELLASSVPGIDVILGGRDRMIMPPTRYDTTGPIMAQVGSRGQLIGLLELEISAAGELVGFSGKPHILTDRYPDDPAIVELLARLMR